MHYQDTAPADIEPADPASPWVEFRVDHETRRNQLLRRLMASDAVVSVALGPKPLFSLRVWSMDLERRVLSLHGDSNHAQHPLPAPPSCLWGVSYLELCKLQFELYDAQWLQNGRIALLKCRLPDAVYTLRRRDSLRLQVDEASAPLLTLQHPLDITRPLVLRALNISERGCALWRPISAPPLTPGMVLPAVEVQLDAEHIFFADLVVQHVSLLKVNDPEQPEGLRIGCAWQRLSAAASSTLVAWMQTSQQRGGALNSLFGGL